MFETTYGGGGGGERKNLRLALGFRKSSKHIPN